MKNLSPIVSIVAGVLVLMFPQLLTWVIGIFLIVSGVLAFMGKKK